MKLTARLIPWSSVVGTGLMLLDETGRCVGQLALHNVAVSANEDRKTVMVGLAQTVVDTITDVGRLHAIEEEHENVMDAICRTNR